MEKQSFILNWLILPIASAITYLGLDAEKLTILALLMAIDMITGTVKAYVVKSDITSRRWIAGFLSKMVVLLVPFTIALMAKGVDFDIKWFVGLCISILVVAEAYSIVGNIYTIKTGEEVKEIDAVSAIIQALRKIFENILRDK